MRWAVTLGWLLATAGLRAEAPLDLNSPFEKVSLVKAKTGEVEKRLIQKARLVGESVEMEKAEGGVAIFPLKDVVAILPLLPKGDEPYPPEQAEAARQLLQKTPPDVLRQAGLDATQPEAWERYREKLRDLQTRKEEQERKEKEAKETEAKANLTQEVQAWLGHAQGFLLSRNEKELLELRQSGEALAWRSPDSRDVILEALAVLSQVVPKEKGGPLPELSKLNELQARLIPDDLLGWLAGGVLIFSFFGLLFGLAFLSSGLARFREGAWLGGVVFGLAGAGLLGLVAWSWVPTPVTGQAMARVADPKLEVLGMYLKNRIRPVYYFPAKQFSLSPEEWRSVVRGALTTEEKSMGLFKVQMKEGHLWLEGNTWIWQQPLTALGVPLPMMLTFAGTVPGWRDWETPPIGKVSLGRWVLPESFAGLLKDSALGIWQRGLSAAGLAGIELEKDSQGLLSISVPAAGARPKYELTKKEEKKEENPKPIQAYKKEISAEELAQAIVDRKGREFLNKFVTLDGEVHSVGGSNFSSVGKMSRDQLEDIYLLGIKDFYGVGRPLLIKCQIKSDVVFQMDNRGDLYIRYVLQEFEQEKKKAQTSDAFLKAKQISFRTIDGIEVTSPDIDPAKEKPLIYRGRRLQFLSPQRLELKEVEIQANMTTGGLAGRPPGTNQAGDIELYGLVLAPNQSIHEVMVEKEP